MTRVLYGRTLFLVDLYNLDGVHWSCLSALPLRRLFSAILSLDLPSPT